MEGYHDQPDATAAVIDGEGWYHTGDLASMDAQGYLRVEGRLKDMIIRGGENIYTWLFVDALPLTASGKVRKNVLRDQLAAVARPSSRRWEV
jgi:acyl-CoA synthetase (AMP-forming)/AMP-acid ligase II